MLALIVDVFVDLVRDGERVVPLAQLGDCGELRAREHPARGIVGRAHDDGARLRRERLGETVQVDRPLGGHRNEDRFGVAEDGVGSVVLVKRLEHDDFVARVHDPKEC